MSEERKKPLWPFIGAWLIGLPVLYVASFGPACWISSRTDHGKRPLPFLYRPILKLMCWNEEHWEHASRGTALRNSPFCWYAEVGAREGAHWFYTVRYAKNPGDPFRIAGEELEWR